MRNSIVRLASVTIFTSLGASCGAETPDSTEEDRRALVNYLIEKTMQREAFSPAKLDKLDLDVEAAMRAYEDEIVQAESDEELFYAIAKLSNARRDRHLSVWPIEGGIAAPENYPGTGAEAPVAPIRVDVDYSDNDELIVFVSDVAAGNAELDGIRPGDRILAVNGVSIEDRYEQTRPFIRHSTEHGYRKKFSQGFNSRTALLPPQMYADTLDLRLERLDGEVFDASLPYVDAESIEWASTSADRYPGFELLADRGAFDVYRNTEGKDVLILDWHRFNEFLIEDIDWLIAYANENGMLDHDIIFDGTRSGGGSLGAYAIQRLSPKPFKTTFGNLRISDVIPQFIAERVETFEAREQMLDSGTPETIDDGTWLIDWLTDDVQKAYEANQEYTNNVPFKLAHAPKYSDGILHPAEVHFRGEMVCLMGPNGGSHLDQFYAIVTDNDLCETIGMQTGGYSNTWEWEEDVVFPTSGKPAIGFMWNIGHTISPAGKIVEGDPAEIGEFIPLTRDNFATYDALLVERALEILDQQE